MLTMSTPSPFGCVEGDIFGSECTRRDPRGRETKGSKKMKRLKGGWEEGGSSEFKSRAMRSSGAFQEQKIAFE
jgi:hypothetical protein